MSLRDRKVVWGQGRGLLMMMKDYLFLLILDVLEEGVGLWRGLTHTGEGFSVSADFKCFSKEPLSQQRKLP